MTDRKKKAPSLPAQGPNDRKNRLPLFDIICKIAPRAGGAR